MKSEEMNWFINKKVKRLNNHKPNKETKIERIGNRILAAKFVKRKIFFDKQYNSHRIGILCNNHNMH